MGESNFRDELGEVWVPKDAGELEGLLLTIQNEPGKKILKHRIQQTLKTLKEKRHNNWDQSWKDWSGDWSEVWPDWSGDSWSNGWPDGG